MTCRSRSSRFGVAAFASVLLAPALASAAELPPIKTSETNQVAECATPGRLMLYVRQRNPKLDPRYDPLAAEYMRNGGDDIADAALCPVVADRYDGEKSIQS